MTVRDGRFQEDRGEAGKEEGLFSRGGTSVSGGGEQEGRRKPCGFSGSEKQDQGMHEKFEIHEPSQKQGGIDLAPTIKALTSCEEQEGERNILSSFEGQDKSAQNKDAHNERKCQHEMEMKQQQMEDMKQENAKKGVEETDEDSLTPEFESIRPAKRVHRELDYEKLRRSHASTVPMSRKSRIEYYVRRLFNQSSPGETSIVHVRSEQVEIPPRESMTIFRGFFFMWTLRFVDYTIWKVRTSYFNFLLVSLTGYVFWVLFFALVLSGMNFANERSGGKECVTNWVNSGDPSHNFEIAFELSWTTFSTVGYGAVSPSATQAGCWYIRLWCAFEAFFGVIYFGYCSAIFFSKIGTLMSDAHVTFSSALCIQYGSGVMKQQDVGDEEDQKKTSSKDSGYPVMTFRLVNTRGNRIGWEIVDAELKSLVLVNTPMQVNSLSITRDPNIISGFKIRSRYIKGKGGDKNECSHRPPMRLTLRKVDFQPASHPYFAKVWFAHHVLNEDSPFVKESVKEEIRLHDGWPPERNTHESIRSALVEFSNLVVTMGGMSNATHEGVFVEHKYKFDDICIGWQFASLVYLSQKRRAGMNWINLDLSLAHDIRPQVGGGEEQLGGVKLD